MDFIPFSPSTNTNTNDKKKAPNASPHQKMKGTGMPAFGSPALAFGSPAMNTSGNSFSNRTPSPGHNPHYSPSHKPHYSPRHGSQFSPKHMNPHGNRGFNPNFNNRPPGGQYYQNSPSPRGQGFHPRHQFSPYSPEEYKRQMSEPANFKTPYGHGNGRRSFTKQFEKTPRINCNPGGSNYIEDYYNPSMMEDPWQYLNPVLLQS